MRSCFSSPDILAASEARACEVSSLLSERAFMSDCLSENGFGTPATATVAKSDSPRISRALLSIELSVCSPSSSRGRRSASLRRSRVSSAENWRMSS